MSKGLTSAAVWVVSTRLTIDTAPWWPPCKHDLAIAPGAVVPLVSPTAVVHLATTAVLRKVMDAYRAGFAATVGQQSRRVSAGRHANVHVQPVTVEPPADLDPRTVARGRLRPR
jgi:hypothetical protein